MVRFGQKGSTVDYEALLRPLFSYWISGAQYSVIRMIQ